jgi:hypothetical protein
MQIKLSYLDLTHDSGSHVGEPARHLAHSLKIKIIILGHMIILALKSVLRIRIRMFLGHLDPDPYVRGKDPSIFKQNSTCFVGVLKVRNKNSRIRIH